VTTALPSAGLSSSGAKGIVASEWTKLRSVRSTWWTLAAGIFLMLASSALLCATYVSRYDHLSASQRRGFNPTLHSLGGIYLAQLAIGVLGVLAITNEYATGMIRNTFASVPQRQSVLAAKAVVFGLVALAVGEAASFASFWLGQAIFASKHIGAGIGDPEVMRSVIGGGLYLAGIGLLGLGLGALLRRTAGAIAVLFGVILVLPTLANALPSPWNDEVTKLLPGGAGLSIINMGSASDSLSAGAGSALFCAYIAAVLAMAFIAIQRRDA
jgi:ABC-2 type transport system permease protein